MAEIGLFDAMYTARSLRRYKPDSIPDEVIGKILDAAIRAPSGSNQQNWVFIVVKDAEKRRRIGEVYRKGAEILQSLYANRPRPPHMSEKDYQRLLNSATYLFEHLHEAPVHLFACLKDEGTRFGDVTKLPQEVQSRMRALGRTAGSSIYPAVQNIILACRAFGLGTVLTTLHLFHEKEIRELLSIPDDVNTYALLPIGYPINKFGPVKRRPINEVAHLDRFGNNWKA